MRALFLILLIIFLAAFSSVQVVAAESGRWYSAEQAKQGRALFQTNCAGCHGAKAQGVVVDWRKRLSDGSYPPPPLNGSAHAWHHPLSSLKWTVKEGSINRGGKMPGFKSTLSGQDQLATIAFFQSFWDDRIYSGWLSRGGLSK